MQNTIEEQNSSLSALKRKLLVDPGYHTLDYVEEKIGSKLDDLQKILLSVKKQDEEANEKIQDCIKTYATVVSTTVDNTKKQPEPSGANFSNFKEAFRSVQKENEAEKRSRNIRSMNVIVHGCKESENDQRNFAVNLLRDTATKATIKNCIRIGTATKGSCRPLKIVLGSEKEKESLMGNLSSLRNMELYRGVSVTEDLTLEQCKAFKNLANEARERNISEKDSIWRVRGNSKNGFRLKKFPRERPVRVNSVHQPQQI